MPRTKDFAAVIRRKLSTDSNLSDLVDKEAIKCNVAESVYKLRLQYKLSQKQLGRMIGTSECVICRIEDADYDGDYIWMLRRITRKLINA